MKYFFRQKTFLKMAPILAQSADKWAGSYAVVGRIHFTTVLQFSWIT